MITQLKFAGIPVRDQNAALRFYTEKLGFQIATDQPMGEKQRWIELKIPKAETRVVLFTPEGHEDRIGTFFNGSFACDNVQQTYAEGARSRVRATAEGAAVGHVRNLQRPGRQSVRAGDEVA